MKKLLPSWFWRVFTGLMLGVILDVLLLQFLMESKEFDHVTSLLDMVMMPFWLPVWTLVILINVLPDFFGGILFIGMFLLHPVFFASVFYCTGEKQTRKVVITEVLLVCLYIGLFFVGMFNQL